MWLLNCFSFSPGAEGVVTLDFLHVERPLLAFSITNGMAIRLTILNVLRTEEESGFREKGRDIESPRGGHAFLQRVARVWLSGTRALELYQISSIKYRADVALAVASQCFPAFAKLNLRMAGLATVCPPTLGLVAAFLDYQSAVSLELVNRYFREKMKKSRYWWDVAERLGVFCCVRRPR
eukprot:1116426-Amorphochlora_amoeboformis.AAC.1